MKNEACYLTVSCRRNAPAATLAAASTKVDTVEREGKKKQEKRNRNRMKDASSPQVSPHVSGTPLQKWVITGPLLLAASFDSHSSDLCALVLNTMFRSQEIQLSFWPPIVAAEPFFFFFFKVLSGLFSQSTGSAVPLAGDITENSH